MQQDSRPLPAANRTVEAVYLGQASARKAPTPRPQRHIVLGAKQYDVTLLSTGLGLSLPVLVAMGSFAEDGLEVAVLAIAFQ